MVKIAYRPSQGVSIGISANFLPNICLLWYAQKSNVQCGESGRIARRHEVPSGIHRRGKVGHSTQELDTATCKKFQIWSKESLADSPGKRLRSRKRIAATLPKGSETLFRSGRDRPALGEARLDLCRNACWRVPDKCGCPHRGNSGHRPPDRPPRDGSVPVR
jgi:hypothetical protein